MTEQPNALYRFFDSAGTLLYVGITVDPGIRWKDHAKKKSWWKDVARADVEQFPDRPSVEAAEKTAIQNERPVWNIHHNLQRTPPKPRADDPNPYGTKVCSFKNRRDEYRRTIPLRLYYEIPNDAMSDSFTPDEIDAADLFEEWRDRTDVDRQAEQAFGRGALPIRWYVEGPGVFEASPVLNQLQDPVEQAANFLTKFTHPVPYRDYDNGYGDSPIFDLDWYELPVVEKAWRTGRLPSGVVTKGGFIQEATGWKPRPLVPFVNARMLSESLRARDRAGWRAR